MVAAPAATVPLKNCLLFTPMPVSSAEKQKRPSTAIVDGQYWGVFALNFNFARRCCRGSQLQGYPITSCESTIAAAIAPIETRRVIAWRRM